MKNVILIGMPSCGKSTIGVVLAKALGYRFIDSDLLIQDKENRLLCEIIEEDGLEEFNKIENEVNASINLDHSVIATGGSVIYGKEAMNHLRTIGKVIYLKLSYEEIEDRLGDLTSRGVSIKEGQTLKELYDERTPLYEKYADIIISTESLSIRDTVGLIKKQLRF